MSPGPIQLDQATALTLMLGPNGSVGIQASDDGEAKLASELFEARVVALFGLRSLRFDRGSLRGSLAKGRGGTCQQLWDTRELHLVSLDYGGETREVGAIDVNIDQDLVA